MAPQGEGADTPPRELTSPPLRFGENMLRGFAAQEPDCISLTVTLSQGRRRRPTRPVGSRIGGELTLHIAVGLG